MKKCYVVTYSREDVKIVLGVFSSYSKALDYVLGCINSSNFEVISKMMILDYSNNSCYDIVTCGVDFCD